ncbi:uncharacterized protein LOC121874906 [Homarus americanus]|uniref:uncharacterized protein LOC121874906 n=1 Tax=Homarus americanus TaxID=6706 RepID=UPI001C45317D|nr:uncharacterized protein LOC121874906 [Homarus americanus]
MKFLVILLFFNALTWAEETGECQCMAALKYHSSHPTCTLYEMAPFESADCNDVETCQAECQKEWDAVTNGGDLNYILDDGTVLGQSMCTSLKEEGYHNLQPSTVYLAYNLCSGGWKDVSIASDMLLCCEGGVYPGEC